MNSRIYWSDVYHWRSGPREYSFRYPAVMLGIDCAEFEKLDSLFPYLSQRRLALLNVKAEDYLTGSAPLAEKLRAVLVQIGVTTAPVSTTLVTIPRFLNYVFNPVSFWVSFDSDKGLHSLVIEVNNTFGETHIYPFDGKGVQLPAQFNFPKEFYVSPFFAVSGEYQFKLLECGERLHIEVELRQGGSLVFAARLLGEARELSVGAIRSTLARYPFDMLLTMIRIHYEAIRLLWRAKATVFRKPTPQSMSTIRIKQQLIHRLRLVFLKGFRQSGE